MSTPTQVDAALNAVAQTISGSIRQRAVAKDNLRVARNQLNSIGTVYADEIAEIQSYAPTGEFESLAKDRFAKFSAEKASLQANIEAEMTALGMSF